MNLRYMAVLVSAALIIACKGPEPGPEVGQTDKGAVLLAPFKANLKKELVASMQSGVDDAIAACSG